MTTIIVYCSEFYVSNSIENYRFRYCQLVLLYTLNLNRNIIKQKKPLENLKNYVTVIRTIVEGIQEVPTIGNVKFKEVINNENNAYPEITNLVFYGKNYILRYVQVIIPKECSFF